MADFLLELWKAAARIAMALLAATPERAASADCRSSEGRTIEAIVVGVLGAFVCPGQPSWDVGIGRQFRESVERSWWSTIARSLSFRLRVFGPGLGLDCRGTRITSSLIG